MPVNSGAVITGSRNFDNLVSVKNIPYPKLGDKEIIVEGVAYAMNPTDWKHILPESLVSHVTSDVGKFLGFGFRSILEPLGSIGASVGNFLGKRMTVVQSGKTLGCDVAGRVVEVGSKVKGFQKGDLVCTSVHGATSKNGAFAKYVLAHPNATMKWDHLSDEPLTPGQYHGAKVDTFERAATLSVGMTTVGLSLYCHLGLRKGDDNYLLIWGGASATGILAIQVAKQLFGIKVIAIAAAHNHDFLRSLGADILFDYKEEGVVEKIKSAGSGHIKYAFDCVASPKTIQMVYDATEGLGDVRIENLLFLNENHVVTKPDRKVIFTSAVAYTVDGARHLGKRASPEVLKDFVVFWNELLPPVLKNIKTAPMEVLPQGLESANLGLRMLIENTASGRKVVFRKKDDE